MSISPHIRSRRSSRAAVGVLGAAALIALGTAPAALADADEPALALGTVSSIEGVQPGSTFSAPVTVTNKGTEALDKVWVSYSVTRGLDYADLPSNCQAHQVPSYDEMTAKWNAVCEFDQEVKPGVSYAPEQPLAIKALDRALYDDLRISAWDDEPPLDEAATEPVPGTAPAVKLVEKQGGGEATDDAADVPVTTANKADLKVTGAQLKGKVGDTVDMTVKFADAGPAWVLQRKVDAPLVSVLITPPAGTSVVKAHGYCDPEGKAYSCGISQRWVDEDGGETYTFKLKIDKKVKGAEGSVALSTDEARPYDLNKANDKAPITLDVSDGASTGDSNGSTGGSGGGSTDGGSTGGSSSTGGSGSASSGGSGSSSTGGGSSTDGGGLASTGSDVLPIAGAAAAAVAVGTGAVVLVRRRRAQGQG